jgi:hypothetical protein
VILAAALLAVAGCSAIEDKITDSANELAADALASGVEARLAEAGVQLQEEPDCETDLRRDGATLTGTATCDAVTVDGFNAHATFDGTLTSAGCTGTVSIEVEGRVVVDGRDVPDCSVEL